MSLGEWNPNGSYKNLKMNTKTKSNVWLWKVRYTLYSGREKQMAIP